MSSSPPLVWVLQGRRTGDNLQLKTLAGALGWPYERKSLSYRRHYFTWTPFYGRMGPSLAPVTPAVRAQLVPPWPDLVLSIGWRSAPVARWIAAQGGSRLVALGRPRAPLDAFDLVLTTPQYRLPMADNMIQLDAPLTPLTPAILETAAGAWRERLAHLPRPWIAVLVGGNAAPFRLTTAAAADLGARANAMAQGRGGSLLIATGPRTPPAAAKSLLAQLSVPSHRYLWGDDGENPYFAFLALADELIVTSESVSMVHEAALTGKPVHLFEIPMIGGWFLRALHRLDEGLQTGTGSISEGYRRLIRGGWVCPPRAAEASYAGLIRNGRAVYLGDTSTVVTAPREAADRDRAVDAVRSLFTERD